jgi:hypothetical protein
MDAKPIKLTRSQAPDMPMEDLVGIFGQSDAASFPGAVGVEQTDLDGLGVGGEHGKIDAVAIIGRALRVGQPSVHLIGDTML